MELLTLDTLDEFQKFKTLCGANKQLFDRYFHIGGLTTIAKSKTEWYWVNSGNKVNYEMSWLSKEPNNYNNREMCLTFAKDPTGFNDIACYNASELNFVCQSKK